MNQLDFEKFAKQYKLSRILSQSVCGYFLLSHFRAVSTLVYNSAFYPSLKSTSFLWIPNISKFDPFFISPLSVFALNFLFFRSQNHPFLLSVFKNSSGRQFFGAFVATLPSVLCPVAYFQSWCGFIATHLLINSFRNIFCKDKDVVILKNDFYDD